MATFGHLATGELATTEQRLMQVTTRFVMSLSQGGLEAGSIRRSVMEVATKAIGALAVDEYEIETHTAIVQRTIETVLCTLGRAEDGELG
jgi:hypothetical protein